MCGIVGFSGSGEAGVNIEAALKLLQHRGPDDSGLYIDDSNKVVLGHTRLSILELSPLGHQPMVGANGDVVITFNGEIYNFRELRDELEEKGYSFRGHSDTEVLLNLYIDAGEAMLTRLNGIFAFAVWDHRIKSLLLARDGIGVKPLYYSETLKGFSFSSEIKALLEQATQSRELDLVSLNRYMSFLWCPGDGTPLKSVRKLQPGEALVVCDGKISRKWNWYRLPRYQLSHHILNKDDSVKGTENHLRQAVHRQMVADVPVGAFLSGGLDSSAVVAFAREVNTDIRCFTIETTGSRESGMIDDLPYAKRVSDHLGVQLDIVNIDADQMAEDLQKMVTQLDEPLADPASLNVLYISQLARSNGIKVLLSGAGGDDLFTGYRRHLALSLERYWNWLPSVARSGLEKLTAGLDQRHVLSRRLTKMFNGASLSGNERIINYFRWVRNSDLQSLYSADFKEQLGNERASEPMMSYLSQLSDDIGALDRMLALEQRFFLADHNLIYTDKMSMAASVEVRVPFLDADLVEFSAQIPVKYKQRGREGKWVLKKAMEPYLPHDVIYRPKTGFGAPLRSWMRFELRDLLGDMLSEESLNRRGLFNPQAVHRLIADNDSGRRDASYILLSLLCIEIWCRAYLDSSTSV